MSCPKCGGTSGLARMEWQQFDRTGDWDSRDSSAEYTGGLKHGRWSCLDCGHKFNKDPRTAQRENVQKERGE